MTVKDKSEFLLMQLILMFQTAALQQMGKLKNPLTDTIERDLQQAQISIDIIEMLHARMKGNLTADEDRLFTDILREVKLNYVDEAAKSQAAKNQQPPVSSTSESSPR